MRISGCPWRRGTYALILNLADDLLAAELPPDDEGYGEFQSIITSIGYLPPRTETDPARLLERQREKEVIKRRLLALCEASEPVARVLGSTVERFNGSPGDPHSFDLLDTLLESQVFRLAFWRVAGEEINYRRFFDVNDLAAVRVELPDVFAATHGLTFRLIQEGKVTGLRIDHPDGLYRPPAYFRELQEQCLRNAGASTEEVAACMQRALAGEEPWPLYVVAEKILSEDEPLPPDWAVYGTSGYDFLASVNGLFVDARNERAFTRLYERFIRRGCRCLTSCTPPK